MLTACSTIVVGAWEPERPAGTCCVAFSRPSRSDAPPASTTPANEAGSAAAATSVHSPGVASVQHRLQGGAVGRLGLLCGANLRPGRVIVSGPIDLTENAHHGVLEVLLGESRERVRVGRIRGVGVMHHDLVDADVGGLGHLEAKAGAYDAVFVVGTKDDRFAVVDVDHPLLGALFA